MRGLLIALFFLGGYFQLHSADTDNLRDVLSPEEFRRFGLHKLSEEELEALGEWVSGKDVAPSPEGNLEMDEPGRAQKETVRPKKANEEEAFGSEQIVEMKPSGEAAESLNEIESRVMGEISGWAGYTVFKLENGQVWRQVDGNRFFMGTKTNPKVFIKKGVFGTYFLRFAGYNSQCKVRRVE